MYRNFSTIKSRPRLLLVTEAALPYVCGVSTIVDELTKHFSQLKQWDVLVLAPDTAYPQLNGIDVVGLPAIKVPLYKSVTAVSPFNLRIRKKIKDCLCEFQPDIILTLGGAFLARMTARIANLMNIPVVGLNDTDFVTYGKHYGLGFLSPALVRLTKWIHRSNTVTLVSSPSYLERVRQIGFKNLKLWRFGINTARFSPQFRDEALRQEIISVFPDTQLICLCVSRMASEKSIDQLYEIAKLPHVTLVLVGDGPDRERLEQIFSGTRTIFWGALYDEELARMYASADIFVTASRSETFGLTVLEAMASGVPSVVINGNGIRDTVVHKETGFIGSSPEEMAHYICMLRDDKLLREKMGAAAYQRCDEFSWENSIYNLNEILFQTAMAS